MYEALDILRPDLDGFNSLAWPLDLSGWGSDALKRLQPRRGFLMP